MQVWEKECPRGTARRKQFLANASMACVKNFLNEEIDEHSPKQDWSEVEKPQKLVN
jgi:hypothetical protein